MYCSKWPKENSIAQNIGGELTVQTEGRGRSGSVPSHTGSPTSCGQQQALVEYLDRQAKPRPRPSKTTNAKPKCLAFLSQEVEAAQTVPKAKLLFLNHFGPQGYTTDSQTVWPSQDRFD